MRFFYSTVFSNMSENISTETSSCTSLEMLPFSAGSLIENLRKTQKELSSFMTPRTSSIVRKASSATGRQNVKNHIRESTDALNAFDIQSSKAIRALSGDLENNLKSSLDLCNATSTLSMNEEAFVNDINKLEEDNSSSIKPFNSCPLHGMDFLVGAAKLVQSTIETRAVRVVNPSKQSEEDGFQKGKRLSESPKVSFKLPKDKIREAVVPGSDSVLPPNWSPCSRYTSRQKNIQPTSRTPYNSLTPSER